MDRSSPFGDAAVSSSAKVAHVYDSEDEEDITDELPTRDSMPEPSSKRNKPTEERKSCEAWYEEQGNSKRLLLAMCLGCKEGEPEFFDLDVDETYKSAKNVRQFKPSADDYKDEVMRRSLTKQERPKYWGKPKLLTGLRDNPVTDAKDLEFLLKEENEFRDGLFEAAEERSRQAELHAANPMDAWVGLEPWLRLYHCIITEEVIVAYRSVNDWGDRDATDARNSANRPKTFFELCSNKFNDPSFSPKTLELPDLHDDFCETIELKGCNAPMSTPDKIKDKLSTARASLMTIINKWEMSGNGNGQREADDEQYGHVLPDGQQLWSAPNTNQGDEADFFDGDNRKNFLDKFSSHLFYMWHIFQGNEILFLTLAKLPADFCASSEGVPSTQEEGSRTKKKKDEERAKQQHEIEFRKTVARSFDQLATAAKEATLLKARDALDSMQTQLRKLKREKATIEDQDQESKDDIDREINAKRESMHRREEQIQSLEKELGY